MGASFAKQWAEMDVESYNNNNDDDNDNNNKLNNILKLAVASQEGHMGNKSCIFPANRPTPHFSASPLSLFMKSKN